MNNYIEAVRSIGRSFLGAIAFYTIVPLPKHWQPNFKRIARWTPFIGLFIGGLLGLLDWVLIYCNFPQLTRSALIVAIWVFLTGGLHLDGVIDTADGLAVSDPQRRLAVMQHSVTGAFGVMAAVVVLLLKTAALADLHAYRWLGLMEVAAWGRWGQVLAIALYPYLKPNGKGAFHKQSLRLPQDLLVGWLSLSGLNGIFFFLLPQYWMISLVTIVFGSAIAFLTGFWFYHHLGGHTGDTYGAVVEWTEALLLCTFTIFDGT